MQKDPRDLRIISFIAYSFFLIPLSIIVITFLFFVYGYLFPVERKIISMDPPFDPIPPIYAWE